MHCDESNLVCEIDGEMVGYAKWAWIAAAFATPSRAAFMSIQSIGEAGLEHCFGIES